MKDKEKQITEMAKDIPYLTLSREVFVSMTEMKKVGWTLSEEDNKLIAKELISKGWVKLPEDSVVLTKEEWKQIKSSLYYSKEELEKRLEQERKKTAEKILNELFDIFDNKVGELLKIKKSNNTEYNDGRLCDCCECIDEIRDFATREGVEIKE